jgi:CRISPR-associated protein Cas10/Cmr2 subtype III-B
MIFPSLRGNGIFDALHREAFYSDKWESGAGNEPETTWERFLADKGGWDGMADWLLTPTLPNRFLAVVPAGTGAKHAEEAKAALNVELQAIGEAVWQWLLTHGAKPEWKTRWNEQIKAFPQTTWAVQPWLKRETCLARLNDDANKRLSDFIAFSEQVTDKDDRFFKDGKLNNPGVLWAAHYALLDTKLAARRNTRDFAQWAPVAKETAVKDSLSGKEECIGDEDFWKQLPSDIFKVASHRYDAMNLIKRLWCHPKADIPYLREKLGLEKKMLDRAVRYDTPERIARNNTDSDNPYIAVLAIDGDEIGKWVSGEKLPDFLRQIAPKATEYLQSAGGLQFSEALAAFAMHKARAVVEAHQGDLIYAGGDDVLAVLPSTTAIACALALREAFRTDFDGRMLLPGSRCEVSCGIAVGHQNAPLQMLVKEAQAAEHDAKGEHGRAAVALRLYKRSGEIIYWGCKWEGPALALMRRVTELSRDGKLSGKFAYALAAFLRPYGSNFADKAIILAEFDHVLSRQGDGLSFNERDDLHRQAEAYLDALCRSGNGELASRFANLFLAETFLNRFYGDN